MQRNRNKIFSILVVLGLLAGMMATGHNAAHALASRTFPETGKTVSGRFLEYWEQNGGLAQQGYPISQEMQEKSDTDGKTYTMQYFQRAVFELHPENKPPNDVLLSLLGTFYFNQKYDGKAPNQKANIDNSRRFQETGKTIGGAFRRYWETHGGLAQQGFPVSDEFQEVSPTDGKTYTVQYFQRAVFEYHREFAGTQNEVMLSLLGTFSYDKKYGAGGGGGDKGGAQPPPVPQGALTIVALGDSLTEGDGDEQELGGYPGRLQEAINKVRPGSEVISLGRSGWNSQQMVEEQLPAALEAKPHIALVWIGSNNLWYNTDPQEETAVVEAFTNDIDTTLKSLKGVRIFIGLLDNQSLRPIAADPNGLGLPPEALAQMSHLVNVFNDVVRSKAAQYGATTVDFYNTTIFTDPSTLAEDGGHPNAKGYGIIAQMWFDALSQTLR